MGYPEFQAESQSENQYENQYKSDQEKFNSRCCAQLEWESHPHNTDVQYRMMVGQDENAAVLLWLTRTGRWHKIRRENPLVRTNGISKGDYGRIGDSEILRTSTQPKVAVQSESQHTNSTKVI